MLAFDGFSSISPIGHGFTIPSLGMVPRDDQASGAGSEAMGLQKSSKVDEWIIH